MKPQYKKKYILCILAFLAECILVAFDQYTKWLAITHLKDQNPVILWKEVFEFTYLENRGAAFGLFQDKQIFFFLSAFFMLLVIVWLFCKMPMNKRYMPLSICAVFVSAGAIGNVIDRIRFKFVVDFLYFKWIDFPVFNVADIYVVTATISFAILILFYYKEDELGEIFHR